MPACTMPAQTSTGNPLLSLLPGRMPSADFAGTAMADLLSGMGTGSRKGMEEPVGNRAGKTLLRTPREGTGGVSEKVVSKTVSSRGDSRWERMYPAGVEFYERVIS